LLSWVCFLFHQSTFFILMSLASFQ
jgi:hypothetical protein